MNMTYVGEFVFGYVNGEQVMVTNTPEQIAAFIVEHRFSDVKITSYLDELLITTSMGFLDYVADQDYLKKELLHVLIPMQQGEVEPEAFVPYQKEYSGAILFEKEDVTMHGAVFDVVVTKEPLVMHLFEKGGESVTNIINLHWQDELVALLGLPTHEEDEDIEDEDDRVELYYQIFCYSKELADTVLEYLYDGDEGPLYSRVDEKDGAYLPFLERTQG